MAEAAEQPAGSQSSALKVGNTGEPFRFSNVEALGGFAAEAALPGQTVKVWTQLSLTSDNPAFHRIVESLAGVITHMAKKGGTTVDLRRANTVLLVLKPDGTAELWVDTAAVVGKLLITRAKDAGAPVFEDEIADMVAMAFPSVGIEAKDKVVCLFREAWGFGLAFDFNPNGNLDLPRFEQALGTLKRALRYRHLYEAMSDPTVAVPLVNAGWFPFAEIINAEFRELARHAEAGFRLSDIETKIVAAFDEPRLRHLLDRWGTKPHFGARSSLLKEALEAFTSGKPASAIKIILTEIEGILNDAYKAAHGGKGAKLKDLLAFAQLSAEQRAGGPDTLFFPVDFGRYLAAHTFANFDPLTQTGTAGSRHAVGHGAAAQDTYTMTRALQAILTLDQLAFYT